MTKTRWGIIGPGTIANNFADGIGESASGELVAIASKTETKRQSFGDKYKIAAAKRYARYEDIVKDRDVDAIYIATPHPWHAELALLAIRAGKAVVVEKPAGMNGAEVQVLVDAARQEGVFFMEAFMYRCHPQIARVLDLIKTGKIGEISHIETHFGFSGTFPPTHRLLDPALGGGGILDVGCYPVSLSRLIAGAAIGQPFQNPDKVKGTGILAKTGVDAVAYASLHFPSGFTAEIGCAVQRQMDNSATIHGTKGTIKIHDPWVPGRNKGPSDAKLTVTVDGKATDEVIADKRMLFAFEAEVASKAIADGKLEADAPAMTWADSLGNNATLDLWRAEVGYVTIRDGVKTNKPLKRTLPKGLPVIPKVKVGGMDLSQLVLGCDNKNSLGEGTLLWDAYVEAGGNTFDTGFVYGAGLHEKVLGDWIKARKNASKINVIVKGAHSPYCLPGAIKPQLLISLERLGLEHTPLYIMHRDNPDLEVGKFAEALNHLIRDGLIGAYGLSNWSPARYAEIQTYAKKHKLVGPVVLNNNLALARTVNPLWKGCVGANDPEALALLRKGNAALSWSSQARGYFLPEDIRGKLPKDIGPDFAFDSKDNRERRKRAEKLAKAKGTTAHNVALAWLLAQDFPALAIIGPRTAGELARTLPALNVRLTPEERDWLNLERDKV
jgi:predicted dehydrogenase/aryl-alcohol dehydrogenase-like predicted oxidoreductase